MALLSYRRHRFPPPIIQQAIWLYLRFTLGYRDVEALLAARGLAGIEPLIPPEGSRTRRLDVRGLCLADRRWCRCGEAGAALMATVLPARPAPLVGRRSARLFPSRGQAEHRPRAWWASSMLGRSHMNRIAEA